MNWPTAAISNVDFSGADIFVENRKIGASLGKISVDYTPTIKQYFCGYPSRLRGSEITAEKLVFSCAAVELVSDNFVIASPAAQKTTATGKDTIHFSVTTQPAVYSTIIFHKFNPANGKHFVFTMWRAQVTSGLVYACEQNESQFIALNVVFDALNTTGHGNDKLGVLDIYDSWTPPSAT